MAERPIHLQRDPFGEKILSGTFNWRDQRILDYIRRFVIFGKADSVANIKRQRAISTGALLRSVAWKTWSESGGDVQVFHAHYLYYSKFVELALGRGNPFIGLPPAIPGKRWKPIQMPDGRKRKARPSVPTEMRKQARKFTTYVQDSFSFAGIAMMIYSMNPDADHADKINRALFSRGLAGRSRLATR